MKALSLNQLRKTYNNGLVALKGIDLDVEEGDFFALLGPNGAGKSTTIGIVSSLVTKTSGTVRIFGHDLDKGREAAKQCIGLVPQEINFNQFETVLNILVNQAGYVLLRRGAAARALDVFKLNVEEYPASANAHDSLGEGYAATGDVAQAIRSYERSLELNPQNANAAERLRALRARR